MNQQTHVKNVEVRSSSSRITSQPVSVTELPSKASGFGTRIMQMDTLIRNMAVVGGLVLVLIAVRNSTSPEAQSVFSALQEGAGMKWDESVGKLSFVNSILPKEIQEVWSEKWPIEVFVPADGEILQAWSQNKPYLLIESQSGHVFASADGEVMSIAHGLDEEKIIRVRHDGFETTYGNLQRCEVEIGDSVTAGQQIGILLNKKPLSFEVRLDGRSVDPVPYLP